MNRRFAYQDSLQDRIADGMEVMRVALDQRAPSLALAAAREAARSALLVLGQQAMSQARLRPGTREMSLLRDVATATPQRIDGRAAERQALVSAALEVLEQLFPKPPVQERTQFETQGPHH